MKNEAEKLKWVTCPVLGVFWLGKKRKKITFCHFFVDKGPLESP